MQSWRLIKSGYQSGAMNMAIDEALLRSVAKGFSPPVLRFYRWSPATVTLGYAQSVSADIDLDLCTRAGLDVVRRSTGGRAVLHDCEVTYAVIAPFNSGVFGRSVLDCYRAISEVLLNVFTNLGLPAELVPGKSKGGQMNVSKAVCFSAPSQYELVIEGRKVAGSAQKRFEDCFLQHGSIPLDIDIELLGKALKTDINSVSAGPLETVGWLNHWCNPPLTVSTLEDLIGEEFSRLLGIELKESSLTPDEEAAAHILHVEQFDRSEWLMKR